MKSLRALRIRWTRTAFAVITLAVLLLVPATQAQGMSHTLRLRFDAEQPQPGSIVGVLADGIASTSAPLPAVSRDGLYRVPLAIQYGATITVRILHAGVVGAESNAQVFEGCYWERTGDAVVGGADWSQYLLSVGAGTATAAEQESFVRAFGMRCP